MSLITLVWAQKSIR